MSRSVGPGRPNYTHPTQRGRKPSHAPGRRATVRPPEAHPEVRCSISILSLAVLAAAPAPPDSISPPKDGLELIGQMRQRYLGKWYRTLTFVQKTTLADGKVETWYEAAELPGKLRIDIAPLDGQEHAPVPQRLALRVQGMEARRDQAHDPSR